MPKERIQKTLARMGLGSRREIESWIAADRITVNGKTACLGDLIDEEDRVFIDKRRIYIKPASNIDTQVLIYNKPDGEVCTSSDEAGRRTVFASLPKIKSGRWVMIGRLDLNTQGLLLFTNDGELAARLMHPSYEIEREYATRILGEVTDEMLQNMQQGIELEDGFAKFDKITFQGGEGANQWYHVVLRRGRNREVRRLWESQDLTVSRLMRIRFGNVVIPKGLRRGKTQLMQAAEVDQLKKSVGLQPSQPQNKAKVLTQQTARRRQQKTFNVIRKPKIKRR